MYWFAINHDNKVIHKSPAHEQCNLDQANKDGSKIDIVTLNKLLFFVRRIKSFEDYKLCEICFSPEHETT